MPKSHLEDAFAFQILAAQCKPAIREYHFHPLRQWRFDFAWPDEQVALEIEGGIWGGGRHTRGAGYQEDCVKYAEALCLGWRVLRVTGDMVTSGKALEYVEMLLGRE